MVVTRSKSGATKKITKKSKAVMDHACSIFVEEFMEVYRDKFPDRNSVIKAGKEDWISLTDSNKDVFVAKAEKRDAEFLIKMEANKQDFTKKVTRAKSGTTKKADTKIAVNRKVAERASKKATKKAKAVMDHAFSIFMNEFMKLYREKFPDIDSAAKAGREKWISMTHFDKDPYVAEAKKRDAEFFLWVERFASERKIRITGLHWMQP
ncbi:hypothetical protein FRX31_002637 [Thalictrum thalictroides]|uniref:High mobility group b protein n=1 Tax=Thalictrum thalictroides TaxID=46969 RepID=A0A7J6XD94_THATH|nr:hypothetical protein FRX31_002637 [Thalictrum thalictroides]